MSHDIVADALNKMMNAKRARKREVSIKQHSKLLLSVLAIAKLKGYVKQYEVKGRVLTITFDKFNGCNAIKPHYMVGVAEIEEYVRRYLPAKHIGIIIVSTSRGIMTHHTALEKNIGGVLLAYFY